MSENVEPAQKTVLVVNDNPSMRAVLSVWLKRFARLPFSLQVLTATDGKEAWRILGTGKVDLLLANHHMPTMKGTQLIRRVKSSKRLRRVPCVLESVGGLPELAAEGRGCGADFVISLLNNTQTDLETVVAAALGGDESSALPGRNLAVHESTPHGRAAHQRTAHDRALHAAILPLTFAWWATSWNNSPL